MSDQPLSLSLDVSAVPIKLGGAGYYTVALVNELATRPDIDLNLVARSDDVARWSSIGGAAVTGAVPSNRPARLVFEQLRFPPLLRSLGVAVHHAPHYTMPERASMPCVVTIHDCTFFDHPEWHVRSKAAFFRRAIRRAALHAGALVCVSAVTAERLRANCDVRAPVVVAPHGVDHARFSVREPAPGVDEAALAAAGIPVGRPLVAFVGTLEPRKGVVPLIAAFDRVAELHPDATLVLGGQPGWGLDETLQAVGSSRHGDRIVETGYLPDEAVPALLRRATVVVYPALEEGFGLPALEALACGAPLITTEGTAMAEVAQSAATLVPPADVNALAGAIDAALAQGKLSTEAAGRTALGVELARKYTWAASAALHVSAYHQALLASQ